MKANSNSWGTTFIKHYPPNPKLTKVFKNTSCKSFAPATRTLTGYGYTEEYYPWMNLKNTKPWCLCLAPDKSPILHSWLHVLRECPCHTTFRPILEDIISDLHDTDWNLASFREPKTRLLFLIEFMHQSGAFTKLDIPFTFVLTLPLKWPTSAEPPWATHSPFLSPYLFFFCFYWYSFHCIASQFLPS